MKSPSGNGRAFLLLPVQLPDQKKLASTYLSRARAAAELKKMDMACRDVGKARELGIPEMLLAAIKCN